MSVDQKDKVDVISVAQDGRVTLTISDHLPWDEENEHLLILQDKINLYLSFIESGQIFESYPKAKDANLVISIVLKYAPFGDSLVFLTRCSETVSKAGIDFEWRILRDV